MGRTFVNAGVEFATYLWDYYLNTRFLQLCSLMRDEFSMMLTLTPTSTPFSYISI
jgi:hypothetical protein